MEEKKTCPRCGSDCVIAVANQLHCNGCQLDYAVDRHPVVTRAQTRKNEGVRGGWKRPDASQK